MTFVQVVEASSFSYYSAVVESRAEWASWLRQVLFKKLAVQHPKGDLVQLLAVRVRDFDSKSELDLSRDVSEGFNARSTRRPGGNNS